MSLKGLTINTAPETSAHVKAEDDRTIWEAIFGVDAVLEVGSKLKATLVSNTQLRISDGILVTGGAIGRIPFGEYEDVTIENGTEGQRRSDLIVAEIQANASVERMKLTYVKGTSGAAAADPSYVKGNVYEGAAVRQFPLYRITLNGVTVEAVDALFDTVGNIRQLSEKAGSVDQMNQKVAELKSNTGILEEGSNANGKYRKWRDGTLEQWFQGNRAGSVPHAYGTLYQGVIEWAYPLVFKETPELVICSKIQYDTGASWGTVFSYNNSSAGMRAIDIVARPYAANAFSCLFYAKGKWK